MYRAPCSWFTHSWCVCVCMCMHVYMCVGGVDLGATDAICYKWLLFLGLSNILPLKKPAVACYEADYWRLILDQHSCIASKYLDTVTYFLTVHSRPMCFWGLPCTVLSPHPEQKEAMSLIWGIHPEHLLFINTGLWSLFRSHNPLDVHGVPTVCVMNSRNQHLY